MQMIWLNQGNKHWDTFLRMPRACLVVSVPTLLGLMRLEIG